MKLVSAPGANSDSYGLRQLEFSNTQPLHSQLHSRLDRKERPRADIPAR